jgi:hypothetical protein
MNIGETLGGFFARRAIKKSPVLSALHERSEQLISKIKQNRIDEVVARLGWRVATHIELSKRFGVKAHEMRGRLIGRLCNHSASHPPQA